MYIYMCSDNRHFRRCNRKGVVEKRICYLTAQAELIQNQLMSERGRKKTKKKQSPLGREPQRDRERETRQIYDVVPSPLNCIPQTLWFYQDKKTNTTQHHATQDKQDNTRQSNTRTDQTRHRQQKTAQDTHNQPWTIVYLGSFIVLPIIFKSSEG
jgi:hypothetical protein